MLSKLLEYIPFILNWLIAKITPYGWTDASFSNVVQDVKSVTRKPEKNVDKIVKTLKAEKMPIGKLGKRLILVQKNGGKYFDDFVIIFLKGKPYRMKATGEGGEKWFKGYWRSRWLTGHYPALYSWARGTFPKGSGLPFMRMAYKVEFFNKETGRLRSARDCHFHSGKLNSEEVLKFSMGCMCAKHRKDLLKMRDKTKHIDAFDVSVIPINACKWVHELPFLRGER